MEFGHLLPAIHDEARNIQPYLTFGRNIYRGRDSLLFVDQPPAGGRLYSATQEGISPRKRSCIWIGVVQNRNHSITSQSTPLMSVSIDFYSVFRMLHCSRQIFCLKVLMALPHAQYLTIKPRSWLGALQLDMTEDRLYRLWRLNNVE